VPIMFTILWYTLIFNATNWSDGVPGMTAGIYAIGLLVLLIRTLQLYLTDTTPDMKDNSLFVLGMIGVLLPMACLLWWRGRVPHFLIGDSGAQFAGFMLASLAIIAGGKVATLATVLGVYIIDSVHVVLIRIFQ
jgi:UDP-GlcNAc:undecaprenyl-phosphate/decaprenyl-phosphate GlcNAc-1-phosphate transferase